MHIAALRAWLNRGLQALRKPDDAGEKRFRLLFECMPEPVWIVTDGHFVEANPAALAAIGYSNRPSFLHLHPAEVSPEYQPDGELSRVKAERMIQLAQEQGVHRFEWVYKHLDGSPFPVEVTLTPMDWLGKPSIYCIWRDISERQSIQTELQQRNHLLETAQKAAHMGYFLTDINSGQWTSSPMLDDIMGIDATYSHTVEGWVQLVHPDDRQHAFAEYEDAIKRQKPLHHHYRIVRPCDGATIWVDAWGVFEYDEGQPVKLIGTVMDITERKTAELELAGYRDQLEALVIQRTKELARKSAELQNTAERLQLAMEASTDGLWDRNVVTGESFYSPGYFTMLGYQPDDLPNTVDTWRNLLHPDDRQRLTDSEQQAFESDQFAMEFRLRTREGSYRWVHSRGRVVERDASGNPLRVVGTHVDITERKLAELALIESEHRFKDMADSAPVMIWIAGLDMLCTYFNKVWLDFTGRSLDQEVGNGWAEGVHPDEFDHCLKTYVKAFDARQAFTMDYRLRRHDGEYRWIQDTGTPRFDSQGQFLGYIGSCVDVTERRLVEQQIRELNVSLEQRVEERTAQLATASAAKTQFLAHMSHELRTPMNAVLGLAQLLEKEPLKPGELAMVRHIRESGDTLLHIINDILDFSKIEAGQLRLDPQPFTLPEVFDRVDHLLRIAAENKGLTLTVHQSPTDLGVLVGDPLRVEQILINLIGNAIKFTAQGAITLSVRPVTSNVVPIRIRFEVKDTGIGIAPDAISKLFLPFSQADASITRNFGGTGLGLAISRRLVDLMGGEMGVSSQVGQGSTFWFELPLKPATEPKTQEDSSAQPAAPPPTLQLTGLRVLVVDDSRINLMVAERALKLEGAFVTLAADGQQALQILQAQPQAFDVVLMDIQMPVMDGLTATQEIRKDSALKHLPVIALTAGVLPEERQAALDAGVNAFLAKPLDLQQMNTTIAQYWHTR